MIDMSKKASEAEVRSKVIKRYSNRKQPDVIFPAKRQPNFYDDDDVHQSLFKSIPIGRL